MTCVERANGYLVDAVAFNLNKRIGLGIDGELRARERCPQIRLLSPGRVNQTDDGTQWQPTNGFLIPFHLLLGNSI